MSCTFSSQTIRHINFSSIELNGVGVLQATESTQIPSPGPKGHVTLVPNAAAVSSAASKVPGPATIVAGSPCIPAMAPDSDRPKRKPENRARVIVVMPLNHSQVWAPRPFNQGPTTKHRPAQRPTAAPPSSIIQGASSVPRSTTSRGPAILVPDGSCIPATMLKSASHKPRTAARAMEVKPLDQQGSQAVWPPTQAPTVALPSATVTVPSTAIPTPTTKEATTVLRCATSQGPSTGSTLNPAAQVFVPGAKAHKVPASLAAAADTARPASGKKVQGPAAVVAGGRRIPAIRPASASPMPSARAMEVRPVQRPPVIRQGYRAVAKEVRPIGRSAFQGPVMQPCRQGMPVTPPPASMLGAPVMPLPHHFPGPATMPFPIHSQGNPFAPRPTMIGFSVLPRPFAPTQGYPAPPEFQPVRPIIQPGRAEPYAHLFNGETPHEQVWPRTFGPGQPHTASIFRRLQAQQFLPMPGWYTWLPFENRYDQMPLC